MDTEHAHEGDERTLIAPWTDEQVDSLNGYQRSSVMHPFTCGNRDARHPWEDEYGDFGVLRATPDGWVCAHCRYTQDWTWSWMADGSWRSVKDHMDALFRTGW